MIAHRTILFYIVAGMKEQIALQKNDSKVGVLGRNSVLLQFILFTMAAESFGEVRSSSTSPKLLSPLHSKNHRIKLRDGNDKECGSISAWALSRLDGNWKPIECYTEYEYLIPMDLRHKLLSSATVRKLIKISERDSDFRIDVVLDTPESIPPKGITFFAMIGKDVMMAKQKDPNDSPTPKRDCLEGCGLLDESGLKDGKWTFTNRNGYLSKTLEYSHGKLHGQETYYCGNSNATIQSILTYQENIRHGHYEGRDCESGELTEEGNMENGLKEGVATYRRKDPDSGRYYTFRSMTYESNEPIGKDIRYHPDESVKCELTWVQKNHDTTAIEVYEINIPGGQPILFTRENWDDDLPPEIENAFQNTCSLISS